MTLAEVRPENRPFRPVGHSFEVLYAKETEVLYEGPAGTGKSRTNLEKAFICCEKYPELRVLFLRKTRKSLTNTVLVTWENEVVPPNHSILKGAHRSHRTIYRFPNGSEIDVAGLDDPQKVMSSQYDLILVSEAIDLDEDEIERLKTRLRNGKMPYQQLLLDTNPDKPTHWLNVRCERGLTRRIVSDFKDNPRYWDGETSDWTVEGRKYVVGILDELTGVRYKRLRVGLWAAAEGIIYEGWDPRIHLRTVQELCKQDELPKEWRRLWVVDFGYTNPFVWQQWAIDGDGRAYREKEIYYTGRLVEDHAKQILIEAEGIKPEAIICDHDEEDRATLERHLGMRTIAAHKDVSPGIQAVQARFKVAGDGLPRLFFVRDALVERDTALTEKKKPTSTEEEVEGYIWLQVKNDATQTAQKRGEEPLKKDDHGMDATRYMVAYLDLKVGGWGRDKNALAELQKRLLGPAPENDAT